MLRTILVLAVGALLWVPTPAVVADDKEKADPLFGTWKLVPAKSKFAPGPGPKTHIRKYEPSENGFKLSVDKVDTEGKEDSWNYEGKYDGKLYKVTGSKAVDSVRLYRIDALNTVGVFMKGGDDVALYQRHLSADGKELKVITSGIDAAGKAYFDVSIYTKDK